MKKKFKLEFTLDAGKIFAYAIGVTASLALLSAAYLTLGTAYNAYKQWFYSDVPKQVSPALVMLFEPQNRWGGTGWFTKTDKGQPVIVTNDHVCGGSPTLRAVTQDGFAALAKVIRSSRVVDLCILEVPLPAPTSIRYLTLGNGIKPFEEIFSVGFPLVEQLSFTRGKAMFEHDIFIPFMLAEGAVCEGSNAKPGKMNMLFFEVDVCVVQYRTNHSSLQAFPGQSGSPAFNQQGEVVGVINASNGMTSYAEILLLKDVKEFINQ